MKSFAKLKSVDFFRKLPSELTEATLTGASLSLISTIVMVLLLVMELSSFLAIQTDTKLVIDRSPMNEMLRISFNVSFTKMSCEHLTLDVSDTLGSKKINLAKTVRKVPLTDKMESKADSIMRDDKLPMPNYDDHDEEVMSNLTYSAPLSAAQLSEALERYPIVLVNYYAPWCPWCQRLAPTWQQVADYAHATYPESDGRIRVARVDCTEQQDVCRKQFITGFPTIRVYRQGSDDIVVRGFHEHEAYHGDRTFNALSSFVDSLVLVAGKPHTRIANTRRLTLAQGCQMTGFVMVKKVPGTMHFHMKQQGVSLADDIDVSHSIHQFTFGNKPSPRRLKTLARLKPGGLETDWADKLRGQSFISARPQYTHEHYLQLVRTTVQPTRGGAAASYDAYEYTANSHSYTAQVNEQTTEFVDGVVPAAKFTYQPSAMMVLVTEKPRHWYHFITTTCAIIGGVFTVCGLLDGMSYNAYRVMKKTELGKHR